MIKDDGYKGMNPNTLQRRDVPKSVQPSPPIPYKPGTADIKYTGK